MSYSSKMCLILFVPKWIGERVLGVSRKKNDPSLFLLFIQNKAGNFEVYKPFTEYEIIP